MPPEIQDIQAARRALEAIAADWPTQSTVPNEFALLGAQKLREWEISSSSSGSFGDGNTKRTIDDTKQEGDHGLAVTLGSLPDKNDHE